VSNGALFHANPSLTQGVYLGRQVASKVAQAGEDLLIEAIAACPACGPEGPRHAARIVGLTEAMVGGPSRFGGVET
jgi:hypothetical protein